MFHDTVMSLVVVIVIIVLAVHLEVHGRREPRRRRAGSATLYSDPADPGTTTFVPRPDWYFYFLFYLLRIFKCPNVGDPRHDRRPDDRDDPALRAAVPRPAARAAAAAAARRARRARADRRDDGRADVQGRDRARRSSAPVTPRPSRRAETEQQPAATRRTTGP